MRRTLLTLVGALSALSLTTALYAQNPTPETALLNHTRARSATHASRPSGRGITRDLRDLRRDRRDLRLDRREGAGPCELRRGRAELRGDRREFRRDRRELGHGHRAGRHSRPGARRIRVAPASPWI